MKNNTTRTDPEKIGEFLVRIGVMQRWQQEDVLFAQRSGDTRLFGEIAIEFGYIKDAALQLYVESHNPEFLRSANSLDVTAVPETVTADRSDGLDVGGGACA